MHGYPPERREMHGIFFAIGAGVRAGAHRDSLRAVDVEPFVCRLLGIAPPSGIDGRAPDDMLAEPQTAPSPCSAHAPAATIRVEQALRAPRNAPP